MAFKTPHPIFQTTDTFQQLVDDLNAYGSTLDSDLQYVDSAIGPDAGSGFYLNGLTTTSGNLIDAIQELDSDLHGFGGGTFATETTTEAKTVVGAINEIEAVYDANAGKITTDSALVVNALGSITMTGASGGGFNVDVPGDVILDGDGGDVTFKDNGVTAYNFSSGGTIARTGNLTFDISQDITRDAGGTDIIFSTAATERIRHNLGSSNVIEVTGSYELDATGDITLDAGGNDIAFQGSNVERIKFTMGATNTIAVTGQWVQTTTGLYNVAAATTYTISGTSYTANFGTGTYNTNSGNQIHTITGTHQVNSTGTISQTSSSGSVNLTAGSGNITLDASADITLDADGNDIIFKNGGGADTVTHTLANTAAYTITYPSTVTHEQLAGDLTFNVPGDDVLFKDGTNERIRLNLDTAPSIRFSGSSGTISNNAGALVLDAVGDIELNADNADVILKDASATFGTFTNSGGNLIIKTGTTTALTFSTTNVTAAGTITLPATGTGSITSSEISANTVHGAIDEVNERIPNVFNRSGTLLNP